MSWTRPEDLRDQVRRRWERGELLRHSITGEPVFPLRLRLKGPASAEIAARFDAVRQWVAELKEAPFVRIDTREFTHRLLGRNELPDSAWVESYADALALIGKQRDARLFQALLEQTRQRQPRLVGWLLKRPLRALELRESWNSLLEVVAWLQAHPRPAVYMRQVDLPGIHSKFIEAHRGVLGELLEMSLPAGAIDEACSGASRFAARYGFLEKPVHIRFRLLDPSLAILPGVDLPDFLPDLSLDAASFAALNIPVRQVFITENEINFLAFPRMTNSLVIFGKGYGWEALARTRWLQHCRILYWGDIDTHGFAILDRLRAHFEHVESFLMDRATLMKHERVWSVEKQQVLQDLPRLRLGERALFDELRDNRIRSNLRLEQEMIGFAWIRKALRM